MTPSDAKPKFVYSSSDETVATIDNSGNITVAATGTCVLTVAIENGVFSESVTITCRDTWTVTVASSNAAVNGSGEYRLGETVTIDAGDPAENKAFGSWSSDSEVTFADSTNSTTTFTMIGEDVDISANWKEFHTVTMNGDCNTVDGGTRFVSGTVVGVTCNDNDLIEWSCSDPTVVFADKTNHNTTFVMPDQDVTIDHTFKTYTVTLTGDTNGVTGAGSYAPGTEVQISATPRTGYQFSLTSDMDSLTVSRTDTGYKFTMPEQDITVGVVWEGVEVSMTVEAGTYGNGSTSGSVKFGDVINIKANPTSGTSINSPFDHWEIVTGNGTFANAKANETTFTVSGLPNNYIKAVYAEAYYYNLQVEGSTLPAEQNGSGAYPTEAVVNIKTGATSGTAKNTAFYGWEIVSGSGTIADPKSYETTFTATK